MHNKHNFFTKKFIDLKSTEIPKPYDTDSVNNISAPKQEQTGQSHLIKILLCEDEAFLNTLKKTIKFYMNTQDLEEDLVNY